MNKHEPIKEALSILKESYTPKNLITYMDVVRKQPLRAVLENANLIFSEPTRGHQFFLSLIKCSDLETSELKALKESMQAYYSKAIAGGYPNNEHRESLKESLSIIDKRLQNRASAEYDRDDTIYKLHCGFLPHSTLLEGSISVFLDRVLFNINTDPEIVIEYASALDDPSITDAISTDPGLMIVKNTSIIIGLDIDVDDAYISKIITLPVLISDVYQNNNCNTAVAESLRVLMMKQVAIVNEAIQNSSPEKQMVLSSYMESLMTAYNGLAEYIDNSYSTLQEGIEEVDEPFIEGDDTSDNTLNYPLENLFDGEFLDAVFDDIALEHAFSVQFANTFMDDNEEINLESFNKMMKIAYQYDIALEVGLIRSAARKVALGAEKATVGAIHGLRSSADATKRVAVVAKRIPKHVNTLIDSTIDKFIKMDRNERRERIVEGGYRVKLFKLIRTAILTGAVWAVSPALACIGLIAAVARDKQLDNRVRSRIADEMNDELKIVNEKIEDAKSSNERQKKYQLMRIKDRLEKDILRIKYNIKDMEA